MLKQHAISNSSLHNLKIYSYLIGHNIFSCENLNPSSIQLEGEYWDILSPKNHTRKIDKICKDF